MKTTRIHAPWGLLRQTANVAGWLLGTSLMSMPVLAEEARLGDITVWAAAPEAPEHAPAVGSALLRPPASWAWDSTAPKLDFATGVEHQFMNGLSLDAGVSVAHVLDVPSQTINYRDYFLGMRYGALDTKVWYLPESAGSDESALYYEAGWQQPVSDRLSLSLRLGQFDGASYTGYDTAPSLSLGATTTLGEYGLGLRLIDGGGQMFGGEQDLRLMGSISKPLR